MNLPGNFSYNFSLGNKISTKESDRYALDVLREYPLPDDLVLARNPSNGRQMTLSRYSRTVRSIPGGLLPFLISNMSQLTGSDNRGFLPPYLPVMRGQDRLFGEVCQFLFPDSVALDLPFAVPHLPMPERNWRDKDNAFACKPANCDSNRRISRKSSTKNCRCQEKS